MLNYREVHAARIRGPAPAAESESKGSALPLEGGFARAVAFVSFQADVSRSARPA
jgi:hypothetical protein